MPLPSADELRRCSLFGGLIDAQLQHLIERIQVERVPAGTAFIHEGEIGDRLYCVVSGTVEVRRGARVLIRLPAGQTVGEMELLDMQPRSATVVALTDCELYSLARRDILALQRQDLPAFTLVMMNLARDLSRRLRQMDTGAD